MPRKPKARKLPEPYEKEFKAPERYVKHVRGLVAQQKKPGMQHALMLLESRLKEVKKYRRMPRLSEVMSTLHVENLREAKRQREKLEGLLPNEQG